MARPEFDSLPTYRGFSELTADEVQELRERYYWANGNDVFEDEVTDELLLSEYGGTSFVADDFFCNQ